MSRPFVVAIAGPGSSSGKTGLACAIIERLVQDGPVGAMKIATATPDKICERSGLPCSCLMFDGRMRILEKDCIDDREGKDTWRMARAGASPVWFVQTTRDVALESARAAVARWSGATPAPPPENPADVDTLTASPPATVVIEGAGAIRAGLADFAILVAPADGREPKEGWLDGITDDIDAVLTPGGLVPLDGLRDDVFVGSLGTIDQPKPPQAFWARLDSARQRPEN